MKFYTIEAARVEYPHMTGTDKQIAYAASIRIDLARIFKAELGKQQAVASTYSALLGNAAQIAQVAKSKSMAEQEVTRIATETVSKSKARIAELTARIENEDATWWIYNRELDIIESAARFNKR